MANNTPFWVWGLRGHYTSMYGSTFIFENHKIMYLYIKEVQRGRPIWFIQYKFRIKLIMIITLFIDTLLECLCSVVIWWKKYQLISFWSVTRSTAAVWTYLGFIERFDRSELMYIPQACIVTLWWPILWLQDELSPVNMQYLYCQVYVENSVFARAAISIAMQMSILLWKM